MKPDDFIGWCLVGLLTVVIVWRWWHDWKLRRHSRKSQEVWREQTCNHFWQEHGRLQHSE